MVFFVSVAGVADFCFSSSDDESVLDQVSIEILFLHLGQVREKVCFFGSFSSGILNLP